MQIPKDFVKLQPRGEFISINGPIWRKHDESGARAIIGFIAEKRHTNLLGFVHGGMIATLLDTAMALLVFDRFNSRLVTTELIVRFQHSIFPRRWIEVQSEIVGHKGNEIRAQAQLVSRNAVCAHGSGGYLAFPKSVNHKDLQ